MGRAAGIVLPESTRFSQALVPNCKHESSFPVFFPRPAHLPFSCVRLPRNCSRPFTHKVTALANETTNNEPSRRRWVSGLEPVRVPSVLFNIHFTNHVYRYPGT